MAVFALTRPGVAVGLTLWLLAAILWTVGAAPPRSLAQPIPVVAASTNAYWAGYVATAGPYSGVAASWTVPAVSCRSSSPAGTAYVWIGEGGYLQGLASPLIQAGTASDCFPGQARYHAFYEWYPGIYATDFPLVIRPGDSISIRITQARPNYWVLSARDDTTGQSSVTATPFRADAGSADFIVERPTLCDESGCEQGLLARFTSITFRAIHTMDAVGAVHDGASPVLAIALVDPTGSHALAVPARIRSDRTVLSVIWRHSQ